MNIPKIFTSGSSLIKTVNRSVIKINTTVFCYLRLLYFSQINDCENHMPLLSKILCYFYINWLTNKIIFNNVEGRFCQLSLSCRAGVKYWLLSFFSSPWSRHQMDTFSALLALCAGNSSVTGEFPSQRAVTQSFDVFFDLCLNKRLSKQWWFESHRAHYDVIVMHGIYDFQ